MLYAIWLSLGVVFVAEMGDKSQLMALAFATRYRALPVLIGITVATALVHAVSVAAGVIIGAAFPIFWITLAAAVAFFVFAAWTLRGDTLGPDEEAMVTHTSRSTVFAVGGAFFLAELGDKTMLATMTLATKEHAVGTWIGSTIGMVAADALAILVGQQLGKRVPERAIKYGAAVLFVAFGIWLVIEAFVNR